MSLTNPNKVVTEERLNEYHNAILPYLGGMPDILANKFSRADLYSTDEKMVGRWTDGKPLYQKVVTFTAMSSSGKQQITNFLGGGIDTLVSLEGFGKDEGGFVFFLDYGVDDSYIAGVYSPELDRYDITFRNVSWAYNKLITCIAQYTKTTDSSVEIGIDTDYSTTEKIVGTWIDGKPIYQKTWTNLEVSVAYNSWTNIIPISETPNVEMVLSASVVDVSDKIIPPLELRMYGGYYQAQNTMSGTTREINYLTLQYTKTTD